MKLPNPYAICLSDSPGRTERLTAHLKERGIDWTYFEGINAPKWGLTTKNPYQMDAPHTDYVMPQRQVGLHLTHYFLWRVMEILGLDEMTILEDDAEFDVDWEVRYREARENLPNDWDFLMLGSGLTAAKPKRQIAGNVWEVFWPVTTHAYIVRKTALPLLFQTQQYSFAPIDLALLFRSWPRMKVYTVLPRLAKQDGTEIEP